jgi:hypothetical protein
MTYQCVNTPTACYHTVRFDQDTGQGGEFSQPLLEAYTAMDVVPLTCDSACQASTGDPQKLGAIMNYIVLFDASGKNFIRMGYTTHNGKDVYFYDSILPGQSYSLHLLGDTEIGPGYPDTFTNTGMNIGASSAQGNQPIAWFVIFGLKHAAQMGAPGEYTYQVSAPGFDPTSFAVARLVMGQYLYGTSGATAVFAGFAHTGYAQVGCACGGSPTGDGQIVAQPAANVPPPYAAWLVKPSSNQPYITQGGFFYTECCQPIEVDISVVGGHN